MKKHSLFLLAPAFVLSLLSLGAASPKTPAPPDLAVTPADYRAIVSFIAVHGDPVYENDTEYVHYDAAGNRHSMVIIRKPDSVPAEEAKPVQISVWVNGHYASDPGTSFSFYSITPDWVVHLNLNAWKARREDVRRGIAELLAKARKEPK